MSKRIEPAIGEVIERFGRKYECREAKNGTCAFCAFNDSGEPRICFSVECAGRFRKDKKFVYFKEVKQ